MFLALSVSLFAAVQALNAEQTRPHQSSQPILWSELGSKVMTQYSGDGLAVFTDHLGSVRLRCSFQQLSGEVTATGLWLTSTAERAAAERLRVVANYLGRDGGTMAALPERGVAVTESGRARYLRGGLVEEYGVSVDGVRQDLVVTESPQGKGDLRVELGVSGARAEKAAGSVQLVWQQSGRKLAYSKLHVVDAAERPLDARLEVLSEQRLAVVVADCGAVYPVRIDPTFSDANWISMGGADAGVYATVVDAAGNLYIGGEFTSVGGIDASNVAMWNGRSWSALGSGMENGVYTLVLLGSDLYAGGNFITAGGTSANYIAKWDGRTWSPLGSGVDDVVWALAVSGVNLYAGGNFAVAGGNAASHVAKWDGNAWSPLGSGVDDVVWGLAFWGANLYAGGNFITAGGSAANYIAKWDGKTWSPVGSGTDDIVWALAVSGAGLYAGGSFSTAGDNPANHVAKWDGSTWSALGTGMNDIVWALTVSGANLYAGGFFTTAGDNTANYVAQWDGSTWSPVGSGMDDAVWTLAVSGNNLYAGGSFTTAGGNDARYIAAAVAQAVSPALNHAPTIDQVPSMTVPKNGSVQTVSLTGITAGPNEGGQAITMTAIAYNKGTNPADGQNDYIQNLALALPAGGSFVTKMDNSATNIVLTFMPTPDKIGTSTIRVELQDDGGTAGGGIDTTYMSFDVNIAEYNNPPTITIPTSAQTVSIQPGKSSDTIPITVGDAPGETPATDLILTFVSDTPALIPNTAINLAQTGTGANRGLIITPAPNAFGTAKVTATVTDTGLTSSPGVGVKSASIAISVTIIAAQAPFISQVSTNGVVTTNVVTAVNKNSDVIAFTVNDAQTPAAQLGVSVTSNNQTLVPDGNIGFGGSDTNRLMIISPAVNQAGIAQITVTVQDTDGNTSSTTFQFTVVGTTPPVVNQPPSISKINDQTVVVGTSLPIITFTVSDDLTAVGDLKVTATSSNQSLIPANNISLGGNTGTRTLLLNLASGKTGVSAITVTVTDNSTPALSASTSFNVTVTPKVQVVANDFNGDGSPDIILEDASGNLGVWFMNGEALISGNYLSPASVGSDWRVVGTGDFNADGKTDLLFQKADGTLAMWYMDGGRDW